MVAMPRGKLSLSRHKSLIPSVDYYYARAYTTLRGSPATKASTLSIS